jgi:dihydroorotate dehydrogenase
MIHVDLTTKIGDFLELANPYWISSAHYSHKESVIEAWKEFSPAALTLKTSDIDPKKEDKKSVRERTHKILPRYGRSFYCDGPKQDELLTYERTEELLKFAREKLPKTKLGISVLSSPAQDYEKLRQMCGAAEFCELNLKYSFRIKDNPEYLQESAKTFESVLKEIERFLAVFSGLPSFIKLSRELSWLPGSGEFTRLLDSVAKHGKAGLIVANSLKVDIPPFLAAGVEWDLQGGVFCGERLFDQTIDLLGRMKQECEPKKVPLVATGGMIDPEYTILAVRAGASAVQLCTAFDYKGPNFYRTLVWNLENRIKSRGLKSFQRYAERIREEGVASVYSMPFTYYEEFYGEEAQSAMRADVMTSGRMDMFVMSGQTLVTKWKDALTVRFKKDLKARLLLPNPDGGIFVAIQKSWGMSEDSEVGNRKTRLRKTASDIGMLAKNGTKKDLLEIAFTDKCPFLSFYIFDDKVYVAPYPFVLVAGGDMPVPVYVFIAGSQEFARLEKEFHTLYALAGEIGTTQNNPTSHANDPISSTEQ